jgi:hypothetical protein
VSVGPPEKLNGGHDKSVPAGWFNYYEWVEPIFSPLPDSLFQAVNMSIGPALVKICSLIRLLYMGKEYDGREYCGK